MGLQVSQFAKALKTGKNLSLQSRAAFPTGEGETSAKIPLLRSNVSQPFATVF
jgi:hypothetical protein